MPSITSRTERRFCAASSGILILNSLHREKDVDAIQRINAELLKGAVGGDFLLGNMLGCGNDGSDSLRQFFVGQRISVTLSKR